MKWRHSKEAQAQKDKEKEQPDKTLESDRDPKEPVESECESEDRSECESDEAPEEVSGHLDISELNKTSVIMSGTGPAGSAEAAVAGADTEASQMPI